MKRVAFVLPDLYTGGMPRVLEGISTYLPEDEFEQTIILLMDKPVNFKVQGKVIALEKEGGSFFEKGIIFLKRLWKMYRLCRKERFDILVGFGMTANIISILTSSGIRVIATEHNVKSIENHIAAGSVKKKVNQLYDFLIRQTYNHAATVVPVSRVIGEDLAESYGILPEKLHVIYNGVDGDTIQEKGMEPLPPEEQELFAHPVIINVGALSRQKGQWHLIRLMPKLLEVVPDAKLLLLGGGMYQDYYEQLIQERKLSAHVKLLGVKKNPYQYMKCATVFALSSIFEGFPNVLVEAIMVGCPVVSTDCMSGPRELLLDEEEQDAVQSVKTRYQGRYGVLTKPFPQESKTSEADLTAEELAMLEALVEMLQSKELQDRYREAGLLRAKEFHAKAMAEQYAGLVTDICDTNK